MHSAFAQDHAQYPLVRITTLGEFALERLVRAPSRTGDEPPRYARVAQSEWINRGPAMALLKVGDPAPNFTLQTHQGKSLSLSDLLGKKALIWFYPKADTPG